MPTREEINSQINALETTHLFGVRPEIDYLPKLLTEDESVLGIAQAILDEKKWCLVLTYRRLIFLDKGLLWGLKQTEMPLSKISSVESETSFMYGQITILDGVQRMEIKRMRAKAVKPFVDALNQAIYNYTHVQQKQNSRPEYDLADLLVKLNDLRLQGILTNEEFNEQKRKLLSS